MVLVLNVIWMTVQFEQFIKDPTRFNIRERVERYTYITETTMVLSVAVYLLMGVL